MHSTELDTVVIEPAGTAQAAIIWMHGLGADAHDFEPLVPHLQWPASPGLRFIFPNAPVRQVTINNGMRMRAWYDILSMDIPQRQDEAGIRDSGRLIERLIVQQREQGIPGERIILAGFSQGGAMALHAGLRYPERLAGILALSAYLPLAETVASEAHPANTGVPIMMTHGDHDPVIAPRHALASRDHLQSSGYKIDWHVYPMAHEVCWEEIKDIRDWLGRVLGTI
jgi:phospholipase/carboxylesterase